MALTTKAQLLAALKGGQQIRITKATMTGTATNSWNTSINMGVEPPAGTLAGSSTTAGVVPTDATAGFPTINAFGAGETGYLGSVEFSSGGQASSVSRALRLQDLLFKAGAYSFNSNVALAGQPSYASRVPGGDYKGTELWIEAVTAFTGNAAITIGYTNQDGVSGRSTGAVSMGTPNQGQKHNQMPLQSGDTGIQKIDSVLCATATVGTFNVLVTRPLWASRIEVANQPDFHGPDRTDLPIIFADSALFLTAAQEGSSAIPAFDVLLNVIRG